MLVKLRRLVLDMLYKHLVYIAVGRDIIHKLHVQVKLIELRPEPARLLLVVRHVIQLYLGKAAAEGAPDCFHK